jgi:TPR repeat protein
VGNLYAAGIGVRKDLQEAARWYKRAYRNGQSAGAINFSVDLRKQGNSRGAITWLKRAVAMGDGEACLQLAQMYLRSHRQIKVAISLLKKAVASWPSDISEESRDEAAAILRGLSKDV